MSTELGPLPEILYARPETMLRWKEECRQQGCTQ